MRYLACLVLGLASLLASGCILDPNSRLNVNRGDYHDEYDIAGKEGRAGSEGEKQIDPMGQWLYSPEARAINRNLGVSD